MNQDAEPLLHWRVDGILIGDVALVTRLIECTDFESESIATLLQSAK